MLYELVSNNAKFEQIKPIPFQKISDFGQREIELEHLIADNLFGVLFEDERLIPIYQQRRGQSEADIYALNKQGDLIIFELKVHSADQSALSQVLGYAQEASQWSYKDLQYKYQIYKKDESVDLVSAHKEAFDLDQHLSKTKINRRQSLYIVGSAADEKLINAVDYWKKQRISINFLPYRIYELNDKQYFEFFALPYDRHSNPGSVKGVLFDTNRTWDEEAIWYMIKNERVAAFGDANKNVEYVFPGDFVFFFHVGVGIVAAAKVKSGQVRFDEHRDDDAQYRDVEFLTQIPMNRGDIKKAMPISMVREITGKNFFWARTIKVPYLSKSEAENLLNKLKQHLNAQLQLEIF